MTVVVTSAVMAGMNTVAAAAVAVTVEAMEVMVAVTVEAVVVATVEVMGAAIVVVAAAVTVVAAEEVVAGMIGMMMDRGAGMVAARHDVEGALLQGRTVRSAGPRSSSGTVRGRRSDETASSGTASVILPFHSCVVSLLLC